MAQTKFLTFIIFSLFCYEVYACKKGINRPNITSMEGGIFYARSIPKSPNGREGTTEVFRVWIKQDEKLDTYNWFNSGKIVLSWSPVAGKVAIVKYVRDESIDPLSFFVGGKKVKSYSQHDLIALGAKLQRTSCGKTLNLIILGQEQLPGTNNYIFKVEFPAVGIKKFDILTGNLVK